jgi:CIC family chloride channel protein
VERADKRKVLGYMGRAAILSARLRRFQDEHIRETGWIGVGKKVAG